MGDGPNTQDGGERLAQMRLDRMLAGQGMGTRSGVRALVRAGAVRVNGVPARRADMHLDPLADRVTVAGQPVRYRAHIYIMLNKPPGVLSASLDSRQPTVIDLLPSELRRPGLFPVGRLDRDTVGLLLITDDGPFAHEVLAPGRHVPKQYLARLDIPADREDAAAFRAGIRLKDGTECRPAELRPGTDGERVTVWEGKFHQVKRMFEARGKRVLFLKRLSMGALWLDESLRPGQARELDPGEAALAKERLSVPPGGPTFPLSAD